jgi:hypothetical protein
MDWRGPIFARPELLHALARSRSPTTRYLCRMVTPRRPWRHHCRHPLCRTGSAGGIPVVVNLHDRGTLPTGVRRFLRYEGRCVRIGSRSDDPHRQTGTQRPARVPDRCRIVRGAILLECSLSTRHSCCRVDRNCIQPFWRGSCSCRDC